MLATKQMPELNGRRDTCENIYIVRLIYNTWVVLNSIVSFSITTDDLLRHYMTVEDVDQISSTPPQRYEKIKDKQIKIENITYSFIFYCTKNILKFRNNNNNFLTIFSYVTTSWQEEADINCESVTIFTSRKHAYIILTPLNPTFI